jgi:hypothetical protein
VQRVVRQAVRREGRHLARALAHALLEEGEAVPRGGREGLPSLDVAVLALGAEGRPAGRAVAYLYRRELRRDRRARAPRGPGRRQAGRTALVGDHGDARA